MNCANLKVQGFQTEGAQLELQGLACKLCYLKLLQACAHFCILDWEFTFWHASCDKVFGGQESPC